MAKRTKEPGGRKNVLRIRLLDRDRAILNTKAQAAGLETSTWARQVLLADPWEELKDHLEELIAAWFCQWTVNREMPTYLDYLTAAIDPRTPLAVRTFLDESGILNACGVEQPRTPPVKFAAAPVKAKVDSEPAPVAPVKAEAIEATAPVAPLPVKGKRSKGKAKPVVAPEEVAALFTQFKTAEAAGDFDAALAAAAEYQRLTGKWIG
jgi:hypothetical protein